MGNECNVCERADVNKVKDLKDKSNNNQAEEVPNPVNVGSVA